MSNKSQPNLSSEKPKQQTPASAASVLLSPGFQIKQNHLSSTYENLLKHEQQNFEIQYLTKSTQIPKKLLQTEMKEPLAPSALKGEQIFHKYGSMIQNQPVFLRQLIFHNYLPYLPQKFQDEFSQILLMGSGFEVAWWGSLAMVLIRSYRNRHIETTMRQKVTKVLGLGFLFLASSLGFHEEFYIPKLKKCYYKNIKSIDSLMERHVKILKSCGANLEQRTITQPIQTAKSQAEQVKQVEQPTQATQKPKQQIIQNQPTNNNIKPKK